MIKNYFKILFRSLWKHKIFSLINILGLAIGLTCCIFAVIFIHDEVSYDQFNENSDQLYRVLRTNIEEGKKEVHAECSGLLGQAMVDDLPEIDQALRVCPWFEPMNMQTDTKVFKVENVLFTDANFPEVFNLQMKQGNPSTVLQNPASIVLTEGLARKIFGNEDPMGQTLQIFERYDVQVTGIIENTPARSHLKYQALISWNSTHEQGLNFSFMNNWLAQVGTLYVMLAPNAKAGAVDAKMPGMVEKYMANRVGRYEFALQPFSEIYLNSNEVLNQRSVRLGSKQFIWLFSIIAIFVLLIAGVNYINIQTAKSAKRSNEIGIRKVLGASKGSLIRHFLSETLLMSFIALFLAIVFFELLRPVFNQLLDRNLEFQLLFDPLNVLIILGITAAIGLLSGSYPAWILSSFQPVEALRKKARGYSFGNLPRQVLIIFQFAITVLLICSTIVVYRQTDFLLNKELGYDRENILIIEPAGEITGSLKAFRQDLAQNPRILNTSISQATIGAGGTFGTMVKPQGKDQEMGVQAFLVDFNFIKTYGIEVIEGRDFNPDFSTDSSGFIVNEAFVRAAGWESGVNKRFRYDPADSTQYKIIGVVKDFHYEPLYQPIAPAIFYMSPRQRNISVRVAQSDLASVITFLETTWNKYEKKFPFEYVFADQSAAQHYRSEQNLQKTVGMFSLLSIFLACLGLYGLMSYTIEQRTKEIGIRKVLGASIASIVLLLTSNFFRSVLIANIIALPLAYYFLKLWLENYLYRTNLALWILLIPFAMIILIGFLSIAFQAFRASRANPVEALRYE